MRAADASKLNFPVSAVVAIVVWVLSLAGAWYGVQSRLSDIQSDVRNIGTRMDAQSDLGAVKEKQRDDAVDALDKKVKMMELDIKDMDRKVTLLQGGK